MHSETRQQNSNHGMQRHFLLMFVLQLQMTLQQSYIKFQCIIFMLSFVLQYSL